MLRRMLAAAATVGAIAQAAPAQEVAVITPYLAQPGTQISHLFTQRPVLALQLRHLLAQATQLVR